MADKTKRRWYQYSLRALLILMVVASLPLGAHVAWRRFLIAKRLAEIETSFQWLESLDYPDMPNDQPVLVTTTSWSSDRDGPSIGRPRLAFLLSEDAKSFTILTPSLERTTIERERNLGEEYFLESTFERTSFGIAAASSLERREAFFYRDGFSEGLTEQGQLLVLAWACARHGFGGWAIKLYDAAEATPDWQALLEAKDRRNVKARSLLERAAADFADREIRNATENCGSDKPRSELLQTFRWIKEHFPNSQHAAHVQEKVAILEKMVAEDVARERRAAGPPFEQLSNHEQIEELIFQLRDWPPSYGCNPDRDPSAPFERLLTYGYEAIPQLAAALADKSLCRSIERLTRDESKLGLRVRTIGEIVEPLLNRVAGRHFDPAAPIWSQSKRRAAMQDAARIEAMQNAALAWHKQLVTKGEKACIIETIREGGPHCAHLALHLAPKDPDAACDALLEAARKADDEHQFCYSNLLGWIRSDKSVPYLVGQLEHNKIDNRLEAAKALQQLGRPEGVAAMSEQWLSSTNITELKRVGPFLAGSGNPDAIGAVAKRFLEQSIEERAGTMYHARSEANPKLKTSDELRTAMIELLLVALGDTEMRSEPGGYWGGPSIDGLRICDMAGYHLNQLDPIRFPFNIEAALDQRERARGKILLSTRSR
jgi:hypothetical protein